MSFAKRLFSHKIDIFERVVPPPPPDPEPVFVNELRITEMTRSTGGASFTPGVLDISEEQGMCTECNEGVYSLMLRRKVTNYDVLSETRKQSLHSTQYKITFQRHSSLQASSAVSGWVDIQSIGQHGDCVQNDSGTLDFATSVVQAHNGSYYILNKWLCNIPKESNVSYRAVVTVKETGEVPLRTEITNLVTKRCTNIPNIVVEAEYKKVEPKYKLRSFCYDYDQQAGGVDENALP